MNETRSKISSVLGRKKREYGSYIDEIWFKSISKINNQPVQVTVTKAGTSTGLFGSPSIPVTALTLNGEVITYNGENITYTFLSK